MSKSECWEHGEFARMRNGHYNNVSNTKERVEGCPDLLTQTKSIKFYSREYQKCGILSCLFKTANASDMGAFHETFRYFIESGVKSQPGDFDMFFEVIVNGSFQAHLLDVSPYKGLVEDKMDIIQKDAELLLGILISKYIGDPKEISYTIASAIRCMCILQNFRVGETEPQSPLVKAIQDDLVLFDKERNASP